MMSASSSRRLLPVLYSSARRMGNDITCVPKNSLCDTTCHGLTTKMGIYFCMFVYNMPLAVMSLPQ